MCNTMIDVYPRRKVSLTRSVTPDLHSNTGTLHSANIHGVTMALCCLRYVLYSGWNKEQVQVYRSVAVQNRKFYYPCFPFLWPKDKKNLKKAPCLDFLHSLFMTTLQHTCLRAGNNKFRRQNDVSVTLHIVAGAESKKYTVCCGGYGLSSWVVNFWSVTAVSESR